MKPGDYVVLKNDVSNSPRVYKLGPIIKEYVGAEIHELSVVVDGDPSYFGVAVCRSKKDLRLAEAEEIL